MARVGPVVLRTYCYRATQSHAPAHALSRVTTKSFSSSSSIIIGSNNHHRFSLWPPPPPPLPRSPIVAHGFGFGHSAAIPRFFCSTASAAPSDSVQGDLTRTKEVKQSEKDLKDAVQVVGGSQRVIDSDPERQNEALKKYRKILTELAMSGELKPILGRDDEIDRCIEILSRETKNNPFLIGEFGEDRIEVAEGLAHRIVCGNVPDTLVNRKVISLEVDSMLAGGAKFPGDFEEMLQAILKEFTDSKSQIILFIDEIHTVIGAEALRSMLCGGDVQCMGASTLTQYRKCIKDNPAVETEFQLVLCDQPTIVSVISRIFRVIFGA